LIELLHKQGSLRVRATGEGGKQMTISVEKKMVAALITIGRVSSVLGVLWIQAVILIAVGQPCITLGLVALAAGLVGGFVRHKIDARHSEIAMNMTKTPDSPLPLEDSVLIVVLIPRSRLVQIDALIPRTKNLPQARRQWIGDAIDEKLARQRTPEFPIAA
jgi:hypothetical protein